MKRTLALVLVGLGVLVLRPGSAGAQYFGQNKVQYTGFHFQVIQTQHFELVHPAAPEMRET